VLIRPERKRLFYPSGAPAGLNFAHRAARNIEFAAVCLSDGTTMVSLLDGQKGGVTGTITSGYAPSIGPGVQVATSTGSSNRIQFTGGPTSAPTLVTIAGLIGIDTQTTSSINTVILNTGGSGGQGLGWHGSANDWGYFNNGSYVIALGLGPLEVNARYFIAMSFNSVTNELITLARNLRTGEITEGATTSTNTPTAPNGFPCVGNLSGSSSSAMVGNIAAVMFSYDFLDINELRNWSEDPWALWYKIPAIIPLKSAGQITSGTASATGAGAATAVGVPISSATGSSTGAGTANAPSEITFQGAGAAAGTGTATATGSSFNAVTASASGAGTATGLSQSFGTMVGSATGAGVANATAIAINASSGSATGTGTATATDTSTDASTASATGAGAASGVGRSTAASTMSAAGTGAAVGLSDNGATTGSATGAGAANATSIAINSRVASATGAGIASAVGVGTGIGVGGATGTGTATASSVAFKSGVGSATGLGTAVGQAPAGSQAVAAGLGTANANAMSIGTANGVATGSGIATAQSTGTMIIGAVASATGSGQAIGAGAFLRVFVYNYPIGRQMDSDYGIRASKTRQDKLVIGRRGWR
jgi:hypothetical protein